MTSFDSSKLIQERQNIMRLVALFIFGVLALTILTFPHSSKAQKVQVPDPGSFEDFLRKRMPELAPPPPGSSSAVTLLSHVNKIHESSMAKEIQRVDKTTGLVIPIKPFTQPMEKLPEDDPRVVEYQKKLLEFLKRRQQVLQLREEYDRAVGERKRFLQLNNKQSTQKLLQLNNFGLTFQPSYFSTKVAQWNGDIFWAPASMSSDINLQFADEVRAVFGPIPPFDVTTLGKITRPDGSTIETGLLVGEVEGNQVELKPNTSKPDRPLEFEHRDIQGNVIKFTPTIDKCDKPSLAGGVTPCGTASRVSRTVRGNVEWIALARKTRRVQKLDADPYWLPSNQSYELLGYIGFNRVSGELTFFDGTYEGMRFDWKDQIVPPGGNGYKDNQGRATAAQTYDATFRVDCAACHDNKEPRIITPYIKQARVGYRSDDRAGAFSLKELLPALPRNSRMPYRVVGSNYTAVHVDTINDARTIKDPTSNCTGCHGLTNNGTKRFASDAVGKLGTLTGDNNVENNFRTDWALRTGSGQIHPWMVPGDGNVLSADPPAPVLSDADWNTLRAVLENPDSDSKTLKLYTEAPAPESVINDATRIADPSAPTDFSIVTTDNRDGIGESMPKEIHISWNYLNNLGGVPERDDVRFNIAILESDIPLTGDNPTLNQFPTIDQAKGVGAVSIGGGVFTDGPLIILKDISFGGHQRYTDPNPSSLPRQYRVDFPAMNNKRYLIRVVAKRFCFDQSGEKYSSVDHVFSVDVR